MKSKIFNFKHFLGALFIISAAGFISCEKNVIDPIIIDPGVQISFQSDLRPMFVSKCASCHGSTFSTYQSIIDGGYINTTTPESSPLYQKLIESSHAPRTTDTDKQKVLLWIQQGALNN